MKENQVLLTTSLPLPLLKKGKVRDVYEFEDKLLVIATDRISCFDVVLPTGIPSKGEILTTLSNFWFNFTKDIINNHLIATKIEKNKIKELENYKELLNKRTVLVKKAEVIPIECIVRGYLDGSAWKEYQEKKTVCGIKLENHFKKCSKLKIPIFTPSTKVIAGHDENISEEQAKKIVGNKTFEVIKEKSLMIYKIASEYAEKKGIIIADTKLEFGKIKNEIILIDELLTPDSSRFWSKDQYVIGKNQVSFDKQYVRDYLETIDWNKTPPGPELPKEIVMKTKEKYLQALQMLI